DESFRTGAEKIATGSRRGKKSAISAEAHFQGTDSAGAAGAASGAAETADAAGAPGVAGTARGIARRIQSLPTAVKIALPLGLILIIAALLFLYPTDHTGTAGKRAASIKAKGPVAQSRDIDTRYRQLGIQLNIKVKDHDIYRYANEVAVKNGYYRIAETRLRERNPDWIYPENVFIMLDFQPVVVSKGDTLWNLSKNKLIESTIKINDLMRQFAGADKATRARLVKQIKLYAFTAEQMAMLKQAEATLAAEKQQVPGK
ncbi:MAG TPA: hypothetical protein PKN50_10720, partial [Spirochaetota bacterium]|nr:hypothetical protein [Spirochaetota bacterium]